MDSIFDVVGQPHTERTARVKELRELGFGWADLGSEQYWIDQLVTMNEATYQDLMKASAELWRVFDKAARFVLQKHDFYELLSIPEVLWDALDILEPPPTERISRYARFDFSINHSGQIKLLELNSDTPTGYVEAAAATPWMCEQYGISSPNLRMAQLVREAWAADQPAYAASVAYGEHIEDTGTIDLLVKHSGRDIPCIDCLDLWVDEGILRGAENQPIPSLFALYPKEWMTVDEGGEALAYAIETGAVQLYNPVHAILLQSKGLQAVIWGLHELKSDLFDEAEHRTIERYMLPTYNHQVFGSPYVSKSMFGREGGSVKMFDGQGQMDEEDKEGYDTTEWFAPVYQERAELPRIELAAGTHHLLTGVFVINGEPCGLLGRAGGRITGNSSHFIAMGVNTNA